MSATLARRRRRIIARGTPAGAETVMITATAGPDGVPVVKVDSTIDGATLAVLLRFVLKDLKDLPPPAEAETASWWRRVFRRRGV